MNLFSTRLFALLAFWGSSANLAVAQINSAPANPPATVPVSGPYTSGSTIALRATSTMNVASEMGGAFMSPSRCDAEGNLYIRKFAMDRPLLGPVVKIDPEGKRTALFDPAAFSQLALDRADAFSPAPDGGLYQIAQSGVLQPRIYVLHFSSDGSPASPTRLDADFEVYTFAAFPDGNFLLSGVQHDPENRNRSRNFTAVFSADGRELAGLSFQEPRQQPQTPAKTGAKSDPIADRKNAPKKELQESEWWNDTEKPSRLDLADAEAGNDGNLYVMRASSPALVYVIAPSGKIMRTLRVAASVRGAVASAFHVSENRLAISFWNEESQSQTVVVADAQTGRKIASYADPAGLGTSFACYEANAGVFTFLMLGEGNALEVIRAEAQ